jgi:C1A family cysteine protease
MTTTHKRYYGWKRDKEDTRDYPYKASSRVIAALPTSVDLRSNCPPVYDQGQLGSCTANAIAGAIEFDQIKQGKTPFTPSRLFIYYNERAMEGDVSQDAGAAIRDGIKSVSKQGCPPESDWPYNIAEFAVQPPQQAYTDALLERAVLYQRLPVNLLTMQACLASGSPIVFGFEVFSSFESQQVAQTGIVPMPQRGEQLLGGHACVLVGYDNSSSSFIFRNSWGLWGDKGYGYMPYHYVANPNLSSDFWTVKTVS